jgi:hypothetical protein
MSIEEAYNVWANQYDSNLNRTRDMEATVLRILLTTLPSGLNRLEIGGGTGKNTVWLSEKLLNLISVNFMSKCWQSRKQKYLLSMSLFIEQISHYLGPLRWKRLLTFSLVLEHIESLDFIFGQLTTKVKEGGVVYIGELHPFKQYTGYRARLESKPGVTQVLTYFVHHVSDFTEIGTRHWFNVVRVTEHFDDNNRDQIPRILGLLLRKQ